MSSPRSFSGLVALVVLVAISACDTAPPVDVLPARDSLSVNISSLNVTLRAGSDSTTQSFIVNAQRAGVPWTASSSAAWLRLDPTSGVTPAVVSVTVRSTGLPPGEHSAIILLTSPSAAGPPLTATVRLTVTPQPVLTVSPASASFSAVVGQGGTNNVFIAINNGGSGQLQWAAAASAPWITLAPPSGSAPSALAVGVNSTGLAAGTHTGSVTITAAGALASPATIPLTLVLTSPPLAHITTSAAPPNGGTTTGGGSFAVGTSVTVSAAPSAGYVFRNWTENGVVVSSSPSYSFSASGDRALVANFDPAPTVTVTTSSSPAAGGTTSGGGAFPTGTSVTVSAQANTGYTFTNWTENGIVVSTSASYTFTAATNRALIANFAASTVVITTSSNPPGGGTTSGGGSYAPGSSVMVTAVPASGYAFTGWTQGGTIVSTSPSYTFTATANRALVANFTAGQPGTVTISTSSNPTVGGITSGGGTFSSGANVTVVATPSTGYTFSSWTESGTAVSTSASYTFIANASRTLTANFAPTQPGSFTISTSSNPAAGGTTTGGGSYASGASVTVTATPASGYTFSNWTEGGTVVSTSASYTFTATANRTLVANFTPVQQGNVTITTSSNPAAGGSTSGGGSYAPGTSVTVTATPTSGYTFSNWTEGGTAVSTSASYSFTATANRALVANFASAAGNVVITTRSSPPDGGVTNGVQSVPPGTSITVTAFPSGQNVFANWTEGSTVVSQSATYTFTAVANRDLVANFAPIVVTGFTFCCGTLVDGLEEFHMGIRSASPVASARVEFGGRMAPVTYNVAFSRWEGWADFTGLPKGEIPFTGIAKTTSGDSATLTRIMFHDPLPSLTVAAPVDGDVARPSLPYSVSCTDDPDDLPCQISISVEGGGPGTGQVASGTGSVTGTLNLAAHEGRVVSLMISATPPSGRFSWVRRQVYVESSPRLIAAGSADGTILDILGGRVLYRTTSGPPLAIRTLATGAVEVIQTPAGREVRAAFLHPTGAIIDLSLPNPRTFHDWRGGTLTTLCSATCSGLEVDSPFAIYSVGTTLYRRDLRSGVSTVVSTGAGNTDNDVAPDGSVSFWSSGDYSIYWYRAGSTTRVTQDDPAVTWNVSPATDGRSVVWARRNAAGQPILWRIMMHDGVAETELAAPRTTGPGLRLDYDARNGWIAFTREVSGTRSLWTRSPSGELRQASAPAFTTGGIQVLADDGGVILRVNNRLVLVNAGGTAQDVSSTNGTAVWRDGEFYVMIGRTVWRIQR